MSDALDSRSSKRAQSSRGRRKDASKQEQTAAKDNADEKLNIRVKERVEDTGKKSRIGGLLRETPIKGLLTEGTAETLKRPLTGVSNLFRRPASRSGKREPTEEPYNPPERSASPQAAQRNVTPTPPPEPTPHSSHFSSYGFLNVESMASKRPYLAAIDDVDISLLSRFLCTEEEVRDESVPWSWDYLYSTLCTEMREEWTLEKESF